MLLSLVLLAPIFLEPLSAQNDTAYCVPSSEFALGRIRLLDYGPDVREVLGAPLSETPDWDEDDGGQYRLVHLRYRDLLVDLGRDRVQMLETSAPTLSLPSGVRVGSTIKEVAERLRLPNPTAYFRGDTLAPYSCEDGPELTLIMQAHPPQSVLRVQKVRLYTHGP